MKQLRRCICTLLMLLVLSCGPTALLSCVTAPITAEAATVRINKSELALAKGKTFQLKLVGTKKKPNWSSNNPAVASVSKKGQVTAKNPGKVTITAKVGKKKYICKVTVKTPGIVEAYESLLRKYGYKDEVRFRCYDFDSDGVLEILIIKTDYSEFGVFDYVNNNIVSMGSGEPYNNTFYVSRDGKYLITANADIVQLYSWDNGKIKPFREYVYPAEASENSKEYKEWLSAIDFAGKSIWIREKSYRSMDKAVNALHKMFDK